MYVGAALAVGLFDRLAPSAVAVLRLIGAAAVLLAWRRPPAVAWRGRRFARAAAFGLATGLMNLAFYEAIARLPLGTAVAVEFCGPVAVAAIASRRPRDVAAVLLAATGVLLIADVRWSGAPWGVVWALAAATMWAAYILLGARVATAGNGLDDLAVGFGAAAVLLSPVLLFGNPGGAAALVDPVVLGLGRGCRRALQRGALRARPGRPAAGGHRPVRRAARAAAGHRDGRRPGAAGPAARARPRRWGSRPSSVRSRCARGTATRRPDHRNRLRRVIPLRTTLGSRCASLRVMRCSRSPQSPTSVWRRSHTSRRCTGPVRGRSRRLRRQSG